MANRPNGKHHPTAVYAKQVVYGRLRDFCCPAEIAACKRHLDDLERQGSENFPYVFDTTRADRFFRFFRLCRHVRGPLAGQHLELQPWQEFDMGCIYGWVHKDTGARRFNRTLNKRCRGTAKSTENSVKCNYHMTADCIYPPYRPEIARFEQNPEVECVAVDKVQAGRVFDDAKKMALATPQLASRLIIPKSNPVVSRQYGGSMRKLSGETKNKKGGAPSYFCVDEYQDHPSNELYEVGNTSLGKRDQALLDCIMTAGTGADSNPAKTEEDYARKVVFGELTDEHYFVMLREVPPEMDPHDKKLWCWANPMLRFPDAYSQKLLEQTESEYTAAYGSGDADKIRSFLALRLCIWQAASKDSYLSQQQLDMAKAAMVSPEKFAELTDGLEVWCGFDLGKRIDLTGSAAVIPLPDGRIAIKVHGFLPQDGAARHERTDRVPYFDWAKQGYCTLTPGAVTENHYVYDWICKNEQEHNWKLVEIDYDGHNATDLAISIGEDRKNEDFCVEIRQTCAGQTLAVKTFREYLMSGKIVLEYSPLLLWCLRNAMEFANYYGDIRLSKAHKDDSQRIDPLAAAMNALSRALLRENKSDLGKAAASADYEM